MQRSLPVSTTIVIDANVAVWLVLRALADPKVDVLARFTAWGQIGLRLVAPMHFLAECASAIRGAVYTRKITLAEGQVALGEVLGLGIEALPLTAPLCQAAFELAGRLQQAKVYDALYLALANEPNAEFWSADQRLVNGARQVGMTRAHWIGES